MKVIGLIAALLSTYIFATSSLAHSLEPGRYSGTYLCYQGPTDVTVEVFSDSKSGTGRFVFSGPASGSYIVRIVGEGEVYDLIPVRWERQPSGYHMVGARLRRNGDQLDGWITGDQYCKEMHITRIDNARIAEPVETRPVPRTTPAPSQSVQTPPPAAPQTNNSDVGESKIISLSDLLTRSQLIACFESAYNVTADKAAEKVDAQDALAKSMKKAAPYLPKEKIDQFNADQRAIADACRAALAN